MRTSQGYLNKQAIAFGGRPKQGLIIFNHGQKNSHLKLHRNAILSGLIYLIY